MLCDDIARVVGTRRTPLTRLGLVLQIGFLRLTGRSLNSVQVIPPAVLARAVQAADIAAPQLASIRSIYRRRMTLYQHQQAAMAALGFKDYGDASERALTGRLRRMATQTFDSVALTRQAMSWLFAHHWVLPGQSRTEDRVAVAQAYVTKSIRAEMMQAVGRQCVQRWAQELSAVHDEETGETLFEWHSRLRKLGLRSSRRVGRILRKTRSNCHAARLASAPGSQGRMDLGARAVTRSKIRESGRLSSAVLNSVRSFSSASRWISTVR